ncbi:hypothetical protein ALC60_04821, partial [Trachymyrmex zeteki]
WFVLSYVPSMSEKFFTIIKNINVKLSFFSFNKLNSSLKFRTRVSARPVTISINSNRDGIESVRIGSLPLSIGRKGRPRGTHGRALLTYRLPPISHTRNIANRNGRASARKAASLSRRGVARNSALHRDRNDRDKPRYR